MNCDSAGTANVRVFTRQHLFNIMQGQEDISSFEDKLGFLDEYIQNLSNFSEENLKEIKKNFSRFKSEMNRRWTEARRRRDLFLSQNKDWLSGTFTVPKPDNLHCGRGRPLKEFMDCSDRTKRRRTETLRSSVELDTLTFATQTQLIASGKRDAAVVVREVTSHPELATKYKKAYNDSLKDKVIGQITPLKALSIFVDAGLSRTQYNIIRSANKKVYPCYSLVQKAKLDCYPNKEDYKVTDLCAEITLQSILDLTASRLLIHLDEVLDNLIEEERHNFVLICKWGCDGAHQAQYKQKFENDSDSDANLFQTSFVPLQLNCSVNNKTVWQNPTPSSPRYCRPIRIRFIKETVDVTNEEIAYIKSAINTLEETKTTINNNMFSVKHKMLFTMVDGKVCNAATNTTSTMRCYICNLTSKDFNNLSKENEVNPETLEFGLSILHARIRLFESILHIAYKLPVKQWILKSENEKSIVKQRKQDIQYQFRKQMGLRVDIPRQGYGNTNDGNTSRRFFSDHKLSSEITGINVDLIFRLKVILETLSSGFPINKELFSSYAKETAELYVQLYSWYPMTPTMHKILIHGPLVIDKALLPIGQLSEEASEARNKHIRQIRESYARKFSREACNRDVLNRLLISSDPVITGMRPLHRKKTNPFTKESIAMFLPVKPHPQNPSENMNSSDDDDELFSDDEL